MNTARLCFALGAVAFMSTTAHAQTIDFEGYADPSNFVTLTDSGATFVGLAGTTGFEVSAYGSPSWGTLAPQILCPRTASNYCGGDFDVTFAGLVSGLQFFFTGDNAIVSLGVEGFAGATSLGSLSFSSDGVVNTAHWADISSLGSLDRIRVTGAGADEAGLGYDDFSFRAVTGAVPEPATWAMMVLGFGLVGGAMRAARRRQKLTVSYA